MKKQEIKADPIRDQIINFYNYLDDNRNVLYSSVGFIVGVLTLFIVFNNQNNKKLLNSNAISSSAQNFYIDGEEQLAFSRFNEVLEGNFSQESKNQALIYLIDAASNSNNDSLISDYINNYKFKTNDDMLNSMYYMLVGNYMHDKMNYEEAIYNYNVSLKHFDKYPDLLIDAKIALLDSYINMDNINQAQSNINDMKFEELSIQSQNKIESFIHSNSLTLK